MKGYTVHDISHIDALWTLSDLLVSDSHDMNPAEGFVLGMTFLLHDAGMSVASFRNGLADLRQTPAWATSAARLAIDPTATSDASCGLTPEDDSALDYITTDALRLHHAEHARILARQSWRHPLSGEEIYILEKSGLRDFYADTIGTLAASHHWSIKRIQTEFSVPLGSCIGSPTEWSINKIKLATILRCCDAMHIDQSRAPTLLFALSRPEGISRTHWSFQNKLSTPVVRDSKLVYSSTSPFGRDEIDAWQLAWDTIRMIDDEINRSNDLLASINLPTFSVIGVEGARSPERFSESVKVQDWRPILPELKVSDVAHLAKTLGGGDLYNSQWAPLREMLQNAADAIDARVAIDMDFRPEDGQIMISITEMNDRQYSISISDNGLGMSEYVLSGPLLDFGKSFWKSSDLGNEFPALPSKFSSQRGRFGIGFFSVFMWSDDVTVCSKRFDMRKSDTRILHFGRGLQKRPILREALPPEEMGKMSTKISLIVDRSKFSRKREQLLRRLAPGAFLHEDDDELNGIGGDPKTLEGWKCIIGRLTGLLEIPVYLEIAGQRARANLPDWRTTSAERFLSFFNNLSLVSSGQEGFTGAPERLSYVHKRGSMVGRALLLRIDERQEGDSPLAVYERGIYVRMLRSGIVGAIEGASVGAARDKADVELPHEDATWTNEQSHKIFLGVGNIGERISAHTSLLTVGIFNKSEPTFILNRKIVSIDEVRDVVLKTKHIVLRLFQSGREKEFKFNGPENLSIIIGAKIEEERLHPVASLNLQLNEDFDPNVLLEGDDIKPEAGPRNVGISILRYILEPVRNDIEVHKDVRSIEGTSRRTMVLEFKKKHLD